jgi:hypothetical protein
MTPLTYRRRFGETLPALSSGPVFDAAPLESPLVLFPGSKGQSPYSRSEWAPSS